MGRPKKQKAVVEETPVLDAPPVEETVAPTVPKLGFDVWFAMREKKIPGHHLREIIRADFKGRGLSAKETLATFDEALRKYGVKL